ncbi:hypothetical protein GCM10009841_01780 [Microlunatus panaciterrae]|uniref:Uncharacterized membrane protein YhaH (DUF805 family) n=1 Tax=Microlunatus panaciterrae TaxID=400768 RepID=A0ABS2RJT0_9ACTN|nr:FtsX-like permease family protein [Microlunatus panaciterrae]MBM7799260.1 uncharacterized membrane protein YhaH (DUF805 family) [Microlunatus panaciterrae]
MTVPLWLRSIQRRPHTAVLLFLLSSVVVMTSIVGPLLVRAVHQSALTGALETAGLDGTSISVSGDVSADEPWQPARDLAVGVLAAGQEDGSEQLWHRPAVLIKSTTIIIWKSASDDGERNALVNALDDGCDDYVITSGRCPEGVGQAMISSVDAERSKIKTGSVISFALARAPVTKVKIVGIYDPVTSTAADLTRPGSTSGVLAGVQSDPVVMTAIQSENLPLPVKITARMTALPGMTIADEPAVQTSVEQIKMSANAQDRVIAIGTDLPELLDGVDDQARLAQVLVLVTDVQALFLAVFALAVVLQRIGRARAAEWSVGRLRGVTRRRWLSSVYVEPAAALLLGLPLGFAAGVAVARLGVTLTLRPGTPLEIWRWPVLASAGVATVIAFGALVAVSLRSVRQPLADLVQQQAESRRLSTLGAVVHSGVFLLAAVTIYQLVTGGLLTSGGPQLGLLAPGLFALAAALVTVRVAVLVVRRSTTRPPRSLAALVVGRHAARMQSALNPAMIIAVGVALAVFATQVFALSVRNQALRADAVTGASTVLTVSVPPDVDLLAAVRAADPTGRQAMAVKETPVEGFNGISRIVAVDTPRLEAVSSWSPEWSGVADLTRALRGRTTPPITLQGSRVQVDLAGVRVLPQPPADPTSAPANAPVQPPALVLTVEGKGHWQTVNLGPIKGPESSRSRQLSAELPCVQGCRLVSLGLLAGKNAPYKAWFTVAGIATDKQPMGDSATWLTTGGRWRSQSANDTLPKPVSMAIPSATAEGLAIEAFDTQGANLTSVSPSDTADPLPAVLGPTTSAEPVPGSAGAGFGTGLDGQQQKLAIVGRAAVLPRSLDEGVLVDLANAQGLSDPSLSRTSNEVWLAPDAAPSIAKRLAAQGIRVQTRELLSDTRDDLQQQASTRGAAVAVIVGFAALLLTMLALVAARWADAGKRGEDWRALREGGVSPRRLRHLVRVEIAVPAVLGVLVGMLSGAVAARIAGARLPLVDRTEPGPPLSLHLSWPPILLLGLGTVLVIMVIAQVGAMAETRSKEGR